MQPGGEEEVFFDLLKKMILELGTKLFTQPNYEALFFRALRGRYRLWAGLRPIIEKVLRIGRRGYWFQLGSIGIKLVGSPHKTSGL